jgi:putative cell wall-binding protein
VRARLENTVDQVASLEGKVSSGGRLNLSRVFDSYPGRPTIVAPKTGDVLRAGTASEVRWLPAAGGSSEATFEAEIGLPSVSWEEGFEDGDIDGWEVLEGSSWETTSYAHSGDYGMWSGDLVPDGSAAISTTITVPAGGGTLSWWASAAEGVWGGVAIDDMLFFDVPQTGGYSYSSAEIGAGDHRVALYAWMDPAAPDTDADFVAIDDLSLTTHEYTSLGAAGAGETSIGFTVPDVETRDARFRVRANLEGVSSGWAYVRGVRITSDFTGPSAPTDFAATNGRDGDVLLSWTDPSDADFDYTRILRREGQDPTGPDDPDATVVYEGTDGEFHDTGIADGAEMHYAAFAVDENLNWSDGAFVTVTVTDETAPEPVQFVEATMRDGAVVVSWMNPPAWQIAGIRVLRRTDTTPTAFDDPNATCVFDGVGASAWDFDAMLLPDGTKAYYAVFAYDASGHVSDPAATSIVVDTTAPEGAIGFDGLDLKTSAVSGEDMYFTASRNVTLVSDVSGATEMRLDTGDGWSDWEPFAATSAITLPDVDGPTIVFAQYRDDAGNVLDCCATVYYDKRTPDAPTGVEVFNVNYGASLQWDLPDDESVVGWNVYVATAPSGPWSKANEDGFAAEPGLYVRGLDAGIEHYFKVTAVDGVGNESAASDIVSTVPGEGVVRVSGATRYQTAIEVSKASFDAADTVVLVSGAAFPDALSASALAGVYRAPILLTEPTRLTPGVAAEITRLGASHVIIVGGTGAVSDAVKNALPSGLAVERIGGRDRFETSARVAARVEQEMGADFCREAFVANGYSFADPLSVSPYAWSRKMPVLLVRYDEAAPSVADFLADNVDALYVVGGEGVVSEWLPDDLGYPDAQRLAGANRYETAAAAAEFAWEQGWASYGLVGIASGRNFPDALAGAPALGKAGGVILLTDPSWLDPASEDALLSHLDEVEKIQILGGPGAVSNDVAAYLIDLMKGF